MLCPASLTPLPVPHPPPLRSSGIPCNLVSNLNRDVTSEDLHRLLRLVRASLERLSRSRPAAVILEDVASLLQSHRRWVFVAICDLLITDYPQYDWAVGTLDAYDLGADMHRNRLFWVGLLR